MIKRKRHERRRGMEEVLRGDDGGQMRLLLTNIHHSMKPKNLGHQHNDRERDEERGEEERGQGSSYREETRLFSSRWTLIMEGVQESRAGQISSADSSLMCSTGNLKLSDRNWVWNKVYLHISNVLTSRNEHRCFHGYISWRSSEASGASASHQDAKEVESSEQSLSLKHAGYFYEKMMILFILKNNKCVLFCASSENTDLQNRLVLSVLFHRTFGCFVYNLD